ncbi:MAG: MFS transporter [Promethearchaeota archaeon]
MSKSEKIPRRIISAIILLTFSGELAWAVENQYFNLFIYNEIAPVPFYVSLLVSITAVVSTLTTIFMGALSDKKGKRHIFFIVGMTFFTLTTAIFPFSASFGKFFGSVAIAVFMAILFDSIMSFFGATASDATLNAYVTDVTTPENRGKIGSIKEIMFFVALLIIYGLSGILIESLGYYLYFIIIAIIAGIFGIPGAIIAPEPENLKPNQQGYWSTIKDTFNPKTLKENKDLFLVLLSCGVWGIGFFSFFPFILIYVERYLLITIDIASLIVFIAFVISIILAFPTGKLVDKIGRKKVGIVAIVFETISLLLFAFSRDTIFIIITVSCWVFAYLAFNIATRTWLKDLYPEEKRGQFHGYYLVFNILIGMVVGSLLGGFISERFGFYFETVTKLGLLPGFIPPPLLFIVSALIILISIIPLLRAKELER